MPEMPKIWSFRLSQGNVSLVYFKWESQKKVGENGAELVGGGGFFALSNGAVQPHLVRS